MTKPFNILRKKMSLPARKAAAAKTKEMLKEMPLQELRQAHQMSQERLAELLLTKQANVSRIERRTDMYISTLRSYIEAMGGKLDIIAKFPDGEVYINQFEDIDKRAFGWGGIPEQLYVKFTTGPAPMPLLLLMPGKKFGQCLQKIWEVIIVIRQTLKYMMKELQIIRISS